MNSKLFCSVLLPVYNERNEIVQNISAIHDIVREILENTSFEILIIDNGSTDGTEQALADFLRDCPNLRYLRVPEKGRGVAFRHGFYEAHGEYVCILSIDRAWDERFLKRALPILASGVDIVFGPKTHPDSTVNRSLFRNICSFIVRIFLCLLFGLKYKDTQCVKAFRMEAIPFLDSLSDYNYFAETEFYIRAMKCGLKYAEIPVNVVDRRRESKVRIWSIVGFIREAIDFKIKHKMAWAR